MDKARAAGNDDILVCERGASFGYNNLVSDMRSVAVLRETGCPVVFDATHSVQTPGGGGTGALYVGDRIDEDVEGARGAGLHALDVTTLPALTALPDAIDALEKELA